MATLILYPLADGILCVKAILIFRGEGHVTPEEVQAWSPEVTTLFNPTAYNTEALCIQLIK